MFLKMKNYNLSLFFVTMSPWPLFLSISLMFFFVNFVIFLHSEINIFLLINIFSILMMMLFWFKDITMESTFNGLHNNYIINMLIYSMILFIISEIFFFISFFWTYFHMMFSPDVMIGSTWPYKGISVIIYLNLPLLNSLLLISSGCWITLSHYLIMFNKIQMSMVFLFITIVLGFEFIILQMIEYNMSFFSFSDGIFGSIFFIATGFHGIHVFIGMLFLFVMYLRMNKFHFSSIHLLGFEFAIWYWHFVDIVWLFLYMSIYWMGS